MPIEIADRWELGLMALEEAIRHVTGRQDLSQQLERQTRRVNIYSRWSRHYDSQPFDPEQERPYAARMEAAHSRANALREQRLQQG